MAHVVPEQELSSIPGIEYIYVTQTKIKYINTNYKKVSAKMYDHNCDIKLKVADTSFRAHKDVLSESSDYFSAMFSHDMKEKEQSEIELHDISPPGFSVILDYFYHGHVNIDKHTVADVLEAARFFHVDWLIEVCCEYLVRHLSLDDYTEVLHLAEMFALGNLKPNIFKFLSANLLKLIDNPNLGFFEKLSFELLSEFLKEDMYQDISEAFLVSIVLQWVHTDPEQRQEHLPCLLRLIRFPLIDLEDLESLPAEVTSIPEILDSVEEAKRYRYEIPTQSLKNEKRFLARGAREALTVMAFREEQNIVMYKMPENKDFIIEELYKADIDTDFESCGLATLGNFLYAIGGYTPLVESSNRMFRFDTRTREWTELATMNHARVAFAICSSDDRIFVFGGVNHHVDENDVEMDTMLWDVEMYDVLDNSWIELPRLMSQSYSQAAVYTSDCLYVSGGISYEVNDPTLLGSLFKFSLEAQVWENTKEMLYPRHSHSMTHHQGKLIILGGYMSNEPGHFVDCMENEVYDIETNQFTRIMSTPESIGHVFYEARLLNNLLYFVGGVGDNNFLHSYDIEADKMEEGILIGPFIKRFCVLKVALPYEEQ